MANSADPDQPAPSNCISKVVVMTLTVYVSWRNVVVSKYLDRKTLENIVDPGQTTKGAAHQVYTFPFHHISGNVSWSH